MDMVKMNMTIKDIIDLLKICDMAQEYNDSNYAEKPREVCYETEMRIDEIREKIKAIQL